jgi:hypothetical protein
MDSAFSPKIIFASATLCSFLPETITFAPASINAFAADNPIPVVPPIITILFLSNDLLTFEMI